MWCDGAQDKKQSNRKGGGKGGSKCGSIMVAVAADVSHRSAGSICRGTDGRGCALYGRTRSNPGCSRRMPGRTGSAAQPACRSRCKAARPGQLWHRHLLAGPLTCDARSSGSRQCSPSSAVRPGGAAPTSMPGFARSPGCAHSRAHTPQRSVQLQGQCAQTLELKRSAQQASQQPSVQWPTCRCRPPTLRRRAA